MKMISRASIYAVALMLTGCASVESILRTSRTAKAPDDDLFVKEEQFIVTNIPSKFIYTDRTGNDIAARDKAADAMVAYLMAIGTRRMGLRSVNVQPGEKRQVVFDKVTGPTAFMIFCNGICKNTIISVTSLGAHLPGKLTTSRGFPLVEVRTGTYYRAHIAFEVEASKGSSAENAEIVITEFGTPFR
jgi:hypothetical protein